MIDQAVQTQKEKVDQFGEKLMGVLNAGGLSLMISTGHRTGLFDAMSEMAPATSVAIAQRAGLDERYVREWLGAMTTGGIVLYEPETKQYALPAEHAALLTRAAAPNNFATTFQWFSVLGSVEDKIVDCFRNGGGVHYSAYGRFHEVMAEESAQTVVAALSDHILPLDASLAEQLSKGIDVADVGCGSGRALLVLAETYRASRFTGYDFSAEAVANGRTESQRRGLTNLQFEQKDVAELDLRESLDLILAFDSIHDQAKPAQVLKCIYDALRPGGTFLMQDIASSSHLQNNLSNPISAFLYTISCMHCMTVSLAMGGAGLGTCWGEELACEMLQEAGFQKTSVHRLDHDILNTYYVSKKA